MENLYFPHLFTGARELDYHGSRVPGSKITRGYTALIYFLPSDLENSCIEDESFKLSFDGWHVRLCFESYLAEGATRMCTSLLLLSLLS